MKDEAPGASTWGFLILLNHITNPMLMDFQYKLFIVQLVDLRYNADVVLVGHRRLCLNTIQRAECCFLVALVGWQSAT